MGVGLGAWSSVRVLHLLTSHRDSPVRATAPTLLGPTLKGLLQTRISNSLLLMRPPPTSTHPPHPHSSPPHWDSHSTPHRPRTPGLKSLREAELYRGDQERLATLQPADPNHEDQLLLRRLLLLRADPMRGVDVGEALRAAAAKVREGSRGAGQWGTRVSGSVAHGSTLR